MASAYAIDSLATEQTLLAVLRGHFATEDERTRAQALTYHDTFDWRLFAAGTMLAAGTEGGSPVIWWSTLDGHLLHRRLGEPLGDFMRGQPDDAFRSALLERIDSQQLLPVVHVEQRLRGLRVLDGNGKTVVRALVERGTVTDLATGKKRRLVPTLAIVPLRGYDEEGIRVAERLERERRLATVSGCPLTRALSAIGRRAGAVDAPRREALDPSLTIEAAMRSILGGLLELARLNEPGVRDDLDPECLHDFRVAVRRTRSLLGAIKGVLPGRARRRFRKEFRQLGDSTGPVRDLDVRLQELPGQRSLLPEDLRGALDVFERALTRQKRAARLQLLHELSSAHHARLMREWSLFLARSWELERGSAALLPAIEAASAAIRRALDRVTRHGAGLDDTAPAEQLHQMRIDCKKLRYLLESFRSLYPDPSVEALVKSLKRLQDSLGRFNDYEVQQRLPEFFDDELQGEAGARVQLAFEQLVAALRALQVAERASFAQLFAAFVSVANRPRVRTLFGGAPQ